MARNTYYHFDSEGYSDLLYKLFSDRDINDNVINSLLVEAENITNNVLSFEEDITDEFERIDCLSSVDNEDINMLLSNPFLDVYFVNGSFSSVMNGEDINTSEVCFNLVEKNNSSFEKMISSDENTFIFAVDSRELSTIFDSRNLENIKFNNEYMYGYYDIETSSIIKNLNYKSRHSFDGKKDISYENYLCELDMPIVSENPIINDLYKKLYSLEILFSKYVDELGLEDIKKQIKYYASSVVRLKNAISDEMAMDEARISGNLDKEFAL